MTGSIPSRAARHAIAQGWGTHHRESAWGLFGPVWGLSDCAELSLELVKLGF